MTPQEIYKSAKDARNHFAESRRKMVEAYNFFAGHQWSEDERSKLESSQRIPVVFNRIPRVVNAVAGLELENRQQIEYSPRRASRPELAEIVNQACAYFRDKTDAEDEESESFLDLLISGMGCTESYIETEVNPDGDIKINRFDPLELIYDHFSKEKNTDDARWRCRVKHVSRSEIEEKWPEVDIESLKPHHFFEFEEHESELHDATKEPFYGNEDSSRATDKKVYPILHFQWFEREPYWRIGSDSGKVVEMSSDEFTKKIKEYVMLKGLPKVKQYRRKYYQIIMCGETVLDEKKPIIGNQFSIKVMTGMRDRSDNSWFGIVEMMKDPQRYANKWLSQIVHILNTNAKGGLLAEIGAFKDPQEAEQDWSASDRIIHLNAGGLNKIKERAFANYPTGVDKLLNYAMEAINDVPGVNLEMLGAADRFQAAYLERQRRKAGITLMAHFFKSLRKYRKEHARYMIELVRGVSDGRIIKISGDDGNDQFIPLLRSKDDLEYEIDIDDSPASDNFKDRTFDILQSILPLAMQGGIPIPPEIMDYLPLPSNLIAKWKKMLQPQPNPGEEQKKQLMDQLEQIMIQLEVEGKQADNQEKLTQSQLNQAKAQKEMAVAEDESAQAMNKMGLTQAETEMKMRGMINEQTRKFIEMLMNQNRKDAEAKLNGRIN